MKTGKLTAISFPVFSDLLAKHSAAAAAAPDEIPTYGQLWHYKSLKTQAGGGDGFRSASSAEVTSKPSSNANFLAIWTASSLVIYIFVSTTLLDSNS